MMNRSNVLVLLLVFFSVFIINASGQDSSIKNVIVVMMENRSFDHLLGWLHEIVPDIDGLDGSEWNAYDVSNPTSERIYVNKHGYDESPSDPNHDMNSTTEQIYGFHKPYDQFAIPLMNGFVQNAHESNLNTTTVMSMFTRNPQSAPIINELALNYAVFDRWYASVPGPVSTIDFPHRPYFLYFFSRSNF